MDQPLNTDHDLKRFGLESEVVDALNDLDITNRVTFSRRPFGMGGSSDVFKGVYLGESQPNVVVSIKCYRRLWDGEGYMRHALFRELFIWSKLKHENVLPLVGYAIDSGTRYPMLVSPLMTNGDAWGYVIANPGCDLLRLVSGIARGLAYIHEMNVVHGDIKPGNVLVSAEGDARIFDFGTSGMIISTTELGRLDGVARTPGYCSPERLVRGEGETSKPTYESDVWAFGVVVYELFMRQHAREGALDPDEVTRWIMERRLTFPSTPVEPHSSALADVLRSICNDCWELDPSKRIDMKGVQGRLRMHRILFPKRIWTKARSHQNLDRQGQQEVDQQGRRVILCFDGTGNEFSEKSTNVLQFFKCLRKDDPKQIVYYQTGMGTYTHPWLTTKLAVNLSMKWDEAIAWNLENHVEDAYRFLMQTYQHEDKISLFGFSRGAYVARVLAGFLQKIGLLPRENIAQIPFAWKLFKKSKADDELLSCAHYKRSFCISVKIDFMGLWDTVASVGVSGRELPFVTPEVEGYIRVFRQALALDERRAKFKPNFKLPPRHASNAASERTEAAVNAQSSETPNTLEVWFAGCHCDVGGGSLDERTRPSLARIPLRWMIRECFRAETGMTFDAEMLVTYGLPQFDEKALDPAKENEFVDATKFEEFEENYPDLIPSIPYESPRVVIRMFTTTGGLICTVVQILVEGLWTIFCFILFKLSYVLRSFWHIIKYTILFRCLREMAHRVVEYLREMAHRVVGYPRKKAHRSDERNLREQDNETKVQKLSLTRIWQAIKNSKLMKHFYIVSTQDEGGDCDALSPINDQFWRGLWCLLEPWPLVFRVQDSKISDRKKHETQFNLGSGREIYGDAWNGKGETQYINVHLSVFVRMRGLNYRPHAWFFLDPKDRDNLEFWKSEFWRPEKFHWEGVDYSTRESDLTRGGWKRINWVK